MAIATKGESRRGDVKVVLIDTRYVVTEPESFKSVVQRLTGKDSCVSWIEEASFTGAATSKRKRPSPSRVLKNDDVVVAPRSAERGGTGGGDWRLSKGMSFKDLDRMMLEIPAAEELRQLWSQV
ncbi:unnamed protein product [Linum tenue]|uniref:VQ domain-containing protein n=1 Tax=Linum tenue TaxID=586396 RepID=A0AAV0QL00_9ROSI|nr:unnamed protein product [Linum tenue]